MACWQMGRNRDRDTPSCHRVSQRVGMIGTRSAISIRARGHRPQSEAVYMTAPDAFAAPQKALAERGPSIHDSGRLSHLSEAVVEGVAGAADGPDRIGLMA